MRSRRILHFAVFCFALTALFINVSRATPKAEPTLFIKVAGQPDRVFTRSQLLRMKNIKSLTFAADPGVEAKTMTVRHAVPFSEIVGTLPSIQDLTLTFTCTDEFSAAIDASLLMNTKASGAIAYIAVEAPDEKWPKLKDQTGTPGPFYLVWEHPERSGVGREQWPFKLAGFSLEPKSVEARYPQTAPAADVPAESPIRRGYASFMKNCFACHAMNGDKGQPDKYGPDLNLPLNPTEYLASGIFEKIVRDPQSVHHWKKGKMVGFSSDLISDDEVRDLKSYLEHMKTQRSRAAVGG